MASNRSPAGGGHDERGGAEGQEAQSGLGRGEPVDVLRVQGQEGHRANEGRLDDEADQDAAGVGGFGEDRDVDHGAGRSSLDEAERGEQHRRAGQQGDDHGRGPSPRVALKERQRERPRHGDAQHRARPVDLPGCRLARSAAPVRADLGNPARSEPDRQAHWDVDPEDRAPARHQHEPSAKERAQGDRRTGDRAVDTDRPRPGGAGLVAVRDHGDADTQEDRATDPLNEAAPVQDTDRRRQRADQGAGREQDNAPAEEAQPPHRPAQRRRRHEERPQRQGVGVDHPLELAQRRPQCGPHVRQRDGDDRDVQDVHEAGGADQQQDECLPHMAHLSRGFSGGGTRPQT